MPLAKTFRSIRPARRLAATAVWTGLAACLVIAAPPRAEAGGSASPPPAPQEAGRLPGDGAAQVVRVSLRAGRDTPPRLHGAERLEPHGNPFTLVGNRSGLQNAARTAQFGGETWLVPEAAPQGDRETGLTAFQGGASSVASP